jgi:ParB-like chromosome segregation protein Spo0J
MPLLCIRFHFRATLGTTHRQVNVIETACASPHAFQLALRWQQEIAANPQLTKDRIAVREGLSRARLTQIINLLELSESIQQVLRNPPPPLKNSAFSERRLRVLLAHSDTVRRLHDWRQWLI